MNALAKIFGSLSRVKLLRLFFFNRTSTFTFEEVVKRAKISPSEARTELAHLIKADLVKRAGKKPIAPYRLNQKFPHLDALGAFIRTTTSIAPADLVRLLRRSGNVRLVVLTGIFTAVSESEVDLLIVGDRLSERALKQVIQTLESELGREIRYASFTTDDYSYRRGIYDRLIRDIFDYPHEVLLDRIGP
jgi:predicted nucleotidyltransferase